MRATNSSIRSDSAIPRSSQADSCARRGSVEPLRVADPDGAFVLHRDLSGYTGSWRSRGSISPANTLWDVALPIAEIEQLWQLGDAVLMVGPQQVSPGTPSAAPHAALIALDARDGSIRSTDLESDLPTTPRGSGAAR